MSIISGYFLEPQNFSVNDGDGIRTVIFFAGCPLRCEWCANPESQVDINKAKEISGSNNLLYHYNSEQILDIIEKQRIFYRYSGGGVTFSGGEPTFQTEMLRELVNKLYDKAIDLAIETSGQFIFDDIMDILAKLNLIFIDLKHMDNNEHIHYTGVSNERILKNISKINELKVPVVVRIPVICGMNADKENIRKTARFVKKHLNNPMLELLPYHSFGDIKYEELGMEIPSRDFTRPSPEYMEELKEIVSSEGVEVVSY